MTKARKIEVTREIVPISIDAELSTRIKAAVARRRHSKPKKAQVMRELMRMGLDLDEGKVKA